MESLFLFHLPSSVKNIDSMEFVSFLSVAMTVLALPALLLQLLLIYPCLSRGSSGASDGKKKKKKKNLTAIQETWVHPWVGKIPRRREWLPTPVFLPGESHGQKSRVGYSSWGHKESDMTEQLSTHRHIVVCMCQAQSPDL